MKRKDVTGHTFGVWRAIEPIGTREIMCSGQVRHASVWRAFCTNCGTIVERLLMSLQQSTGCVVCRGRPKGHAGMMCVLIIYKHSARHYGREFSLTVDEFREITSSPCHYCGSPPTNVKSPNASPWGSYRYNGIDRVDNTLGYTAGNSVPCCTMCNKAKNDNSYADYCSQIRRIVENASHIPCLVNPRCPPRRRIQISPH